MLQTTAILGARAILRGGELDRPRAGTLAANVTLKCEQCAEIVRFAAGEPAAVCARCGSPSLVPCELPAAGAGVVAIDPTALLDDPGDFLCFEDEGEVVVIPLTRERTRIGRDLAADVRFDDPTVSRRHALIVRTVDGVRVLDDRSLNGVFVNGRSVVEWKQLAHGDEIRVGRRRLYYATRNPVDP